MLTFVYISSNGQSLDWGEKANPLLNSINAVAFNADGDEVISGTNCHPASIRIFETENGNLKWDYEVGSSFMCIMGVTISANKNYIAAIEEFGNIFIFDNTGALPVIIDTIATETDYGFAVAIAPDNSMLLVGCSNGKMLGYDISNGDLIFDINAHASWVTTVTFSPDGNYIVTGGSDDKVKIWDMNGNLLSTSSGHLGDITAVKVSSDNQYVVSSSKDDLIKIWDIGTGVEVRTLSGHENNVNGVDLSPDGKYIVSVSTDATNKIWKFETGELLSTFGFADSGAVNAVAWSPLGDKIVTGNEQSDVMMWSVDFSALDISTQSNQSISVYPNPASNVLNITLPANFIYDDIVVVDISGKEVLSSKQITNIDIHELQTGIYMLLIYSKNEIIARQKIEIIKF